MFNRMNNRRSNRGTSLVEMVTGAIFFIPIALAAVDLVSLSLVEQANDHIARDAARAAANQMNETDAKAAAQKAVNMFKTNALITKVEIVKFSFKDGAVQLETSIQARVPAPVVGFSGKTLVAQSFQPIVGIPADL
jgi:Flp pilus assembly protein TadG